MPYCTVCGTKIGEGYEFCPACGKALKVEETESVDQPSAQPSKRSFKIIIVMLIAAVLAVGAYAVIKFNDENERGNTVGNIVNGGLAAKQGDWIYYVKDDNRCIYKIRTDGSGRVKINDDNSWDVNVIGDWIYYVNDYDRCIYKIRTNGRGRVKVNDDESHSINVVGDWIYYIHYDDTRNIYKIRTDGSDGQAMY